MKLPCALGSWGKGSKLCNDILERGIKCRVIRYSIAGVCAEQPPGDFCPRLKFLRGSIWGGSREEKLNVWSTISPSIASVWIKARLASVFPVVFWLASLNTHREQKATIRTLLGSNPR